ncbi:MAG: tRNA (guanosine(46)-N7)-methyltransferase TrmB [Bacilli bacterium]|nr:tRNA (guanosine(46)-N7)-methyltransferase TrmB [Bacilli bacterium]MDD4076888.1 tRNA (guanosine(46)-N7)-methyltransferase TrmB [Bacilli bacterium]MDD4387874.1 tRNA (guanosine(46)-N7)-methyltransferase TrmB [Bacilli bacterium]
MRLRKIKDAEIKLQQYPQYVVFDPAQHYGRWLTFFNNDYPLYLEIGMGKGKFIIEQAARNQGVNFVGCEVYESITLRAVRKIADKDIGNLKMINCNAQDLDKIFAAGEVKKIYLNFSDPWPKARHEKRRLTSKDYMDIYRCILCDNGEIELKTDNPCFFEYSLIQFNNYGFHFTDVSLDLHGSDRENIITTEYEEKFLENEQKIYYLKVKK